MISEFDLGNSVHDKLWYGTQAMANHHNLNVHQYDAGYKQLNSAQAEDVYVSVEDELLAEQSCFDISLDTIREMLTERRSTPLQETLDVSLLYETGD